MSFRLLRFEADVNANVGDTVTDDDLTVVSEPEPEPLSTPGYVENFRVTAGGLSVVNEDINNRDFEAEIGLSVSSVTEQQFIGAQISESVGGSRVLLEGGRNAYDDYIYPHETLEFVYSVTENVGDDIEWEVIPDEKFVIDIPVRTV